MGIIDKFLDDCEARGLTPHTRETYRSNVLHFLETNPEPSKISLDALRKYLKELRSRNLAGSTLKGHFAALSTFYEYLVFEGAAQANPILAFRKRYLARVKYQYGGENTRQPGSLEQIRELLALAAREILASTMILFLAKTGLRRGELIAMDVYDLDLENGIFWVKPKAKRTNRLGFLDAELTTALREYLIWRGEILHGNSHGNSHSNSYGTQDALWINTKGHRVSRNLVYYTIGGYTELAGMHNPHGTVNQKFTTHNLRHFFTTHLRRAGMKREFIQELRGDYRGDSIDIYDHIDPEELRVAYLKFIPQLMHYSVRAADEISGDIEDRKL